MKELLDRFFALSVVELDSEAKRVNRSRAGAEWELAACLLAMAKDERYRSLGYKSLLLYAEAELGLSVRKSIELLRVARLAQQFPSVSEAFARGEVSFCKLREITRRIEPSTAEAWVEYARTHTTRDVERAVAMSPRSYRELAASCDGDAGMEDDLPRQEGLPFVEEAAEDEDTGANPQAPADETDVGMSSTSAPPPGVVVIVGEQQVLGSRPTVQSKDSVRQQAVLPKPRASSTGGTRSRGSNTHGGGTPGNAPPPGPVLVRLTFTLTAEQYAIYEAAERQAKSKLRKRATREEALTYMAQLLRAKANSRTRARYPVVVETENGQSYYPTRMGDLPADVERLRGAMSEQPPVGQAPPAATNPAGAKTSSAKAKRRRAASVASKRRVQPPGTSAGTKAEAEQPVDSAHGNKQTMNAKGIPAQKTATIGKRREVPTRVMRAVMARARWQCEECGSRDLLELDHKTAVIDGGDNSIDNLCVKCRPCHRSRHAADFINGPRYLMGLDYAEARRDARLEAEEEARLLC